MGKKKQERIVMTDKESDYVKILWYSGIAFTSLAAALEVARAMIKSDDKDDDFDDFGDGERPSPVPRSLSPEDVNQFIAHSHEIALILGVIGVLSMVSSVVLLRARRQLTAIV